MPGTLKQIQYATGVSGATVCRWVTFLRECGEAHIGGWAPMVGKGGPMQAIFHAGPGADVVCELHGLTKYQRDRISQERRELANREIRAKQLARTGTVSQNIVIRRDPLTAAFYGDGAA